MPSVSELPSHAQARIAFQEVSRVMGPGWATPYVGVATLLNALLLRPVLLPAAEAVLGRLGWWPTHGPLPPQPARTAVTRRLPGLQTLGRIATEIARGLIALGIERGSGPAPALASGAASFTDRR